MRHQSVTVDKLKCSKQRQKGHSDSSTTEQSRGVVKGRARGGGREVTSIVMRWLRCPLTLTFFNANDDEM